MPTPQSRDAVPRRIPADATAQVVSVTDSAAIEWRVSWIVPTLVLAGMLAWVALEVHALRVSFADTFRLQTEESR